MIHVLTLIRADKSGVFAMPEGQTVDRLTEVYVDGNSVPFTPIKEGTEIDVPAAREDSNVKGLFKK